jgi:hypothetical protein
MVNLCLAESAANKKSVSYNNQAMFTFVLLMTPTGMAIFLQQ